MRIKTRALIYTLLGLVLLLGLLSSFFAPGITKALTLSMSPRPSMKTTPPLLSKPLNPKPTLIPILQGTPPANVQMPTNPTTSILVQDTFQRTNQALWGLSTDNHPWDADAHLAPAFRVAHRLGTISGSPESNGFFDAVIGGQNANTEVLFRASVSNYSQSNIGAVLRWQDSNNWYKAYLDGQQLILIKKVKGVVTRLGAMTLPAQPQMSYTIRFRALDHKLAAKAWLSNDPEPQDWMVAAKDADLSSGLGGLRALVQNTVTIQVSSFEENTV